MSRLKEQVSEAKSFRRCMERFGYQSVMQVPKLEKIVLNMGVGEAAQNAKSLESAMEDLAAISGQKPAVTRAKKSIAAFKIRDGHGHRLQGYFRGASGCTTFSTSLSTWGCPRIRDFRGVSPGSFDGRGNYSLGIREQLIFPEIRYDKVDKIRGLDVSS